MEDEDKELNLNRHYQLQELCNILYKIISVPNTEEIIQEFLKKCCEFLDFFSGGIVLWNSGIGVSRYTYNTPKEYALDGLVFKAEDEGLNSKVYRERKFVEITNYSKSIYAFTPLKFSKIQYFIGIPLYGRDSIIATLSFFTLEKRQKLNLEEKMFLEEIGKQMSVILNFLQTVQKLEDTNDDYNQTYSFLELVLKRSQNIVILLDLSERIKFWNQFAAESINYSSNEIINQHLPLNNDEENRFHQRFLNVKLDQTEIKDIIRIQVKNSLENSRIIYYTLYPIFDKKNRIESILLMGEDVTEKNVLLDELNEYHDILSQKYVELQNFQSLSQQLQSQLESSKRILIIGDFILRYYNQINNPLMIIMNNLHIINQTLPKITEEEIRKRIQLSLDDTVFTAKRIKVLASSLEALADATITRQFRSIELQNVINQAINDYKDQFLNNKIHIKKEIQEVATSYKIEGCFIQLKNLFQILFNNAITALNSVHRMNKKKIITIGLENIEITDQPFIQLTISDNGCGIDPIQLADIFHLFYSNWEIEPNSNSFQEIHIGLGLPIAKIIIESHHGLITVKSALKMGTSFIIQFPKSLS